MICPVFFFLGMLLVICFIVKNKKDRNLCIVAVYFIITMLQGIFVQFLSVNLVMDCLGYTGVAQAETVGLRRMTAASL